MSMKHALNSFLKNSSPDRIALIGLLQIGVLGSIDYLTGYELSFSFFYLFPVATVAWYGRRNTALAIALISAFVWHAANDQAGQIYSHPAIAVWNAGTRLGFFCVVVMLIDGLHKSYAREKTLSRIDHLTGAVNRLSFEEIAKAEMSRSKRYQRHFTVAYFDVDNFKKVNDTLGHNAGSDLLVKVVATIKASLRLSDTIARVGGDEFVMLLPETNAEQAPLVVDKIRGKLDEAMKRESWPVSFSMGVLTCSTPPESMDDMMKKVDELMYDVKKSGKNSVRYACNMPTS